MNRKFFWLIGSAVFTIMSVLVVLFFAPDKVFSGLTLAYLLVPLLMFIGVDCKFEPYEWLMYSISLFATSLILLYGINKIWFGLPFIIVFLTMIIIRAIKKQKTGRIILAIIMQILVTILVFLFANLYVLSNTISNSPFRQETVKTVNESSIVFEGSDKPYTIETSKALLLKQGDTVYVKTYENAIHAIKR